MNKKALSLVEILVACLIFALIMAGMANLFISGKRLILHSRSRMTGGELGKYFLDDLQNLYVRQDTWNSNPLGTAGTPVPIPIPPRSAGTAEGLDRTYGAEYAVNDLQNSDVKRVKVTIKWQEPRM